MISLKLPKSSFHILHSDVILQLGSCFSTNISEKLKYAGFSVLDNPFGVIFHPLALANLLEKAINLDFSRVPLLREDVYLDFQVSGTFFAMSEDDLDTLFQTEITNLHEILMKAKVLFVTFGTAKGFYKSGRVVANCHKQPAQLFDEKISEIEEMFASWKRVLIQLKAFNPNLEVVFTVSPVRYAREGLVENNRSKARLLLLCEQLAEQGAHYFPSYERVLDQLRDYSFFEGDGVHPNAKAIELVWEDFQEVYFNKETKSIIKEYLQIRGLNEHRLLYPESAEAKRFTEMVQKKRESFLTRFPYIKFEF